jgi:type IX secretion system PorP/SprF family membrane protein
MKKLLVLIFVVMLALDGMAQDPQFSQYFAAPIYHNPAFTGAAHKSRVIANYRNQWPSIPGAFVTYATSFDTYFKEYNSGFGLIAYRDRAGSGGFATTSLAGNYAYELSITSDWVARAGLSFGYATRNIDFTKLTFRDQLNANMINMPSADPSLAAFSRPHYFDISSGFLVYSKYFWFGTSLMHMNQPNQSILGETSKLPMRFATMTGMNIPLTKRRYGGARNAQFIEKSFSPSLIYKRQGDFQQLDLGAYVTLQPLVLGMYYRGIPIPGLKQSVNTMDALIWLVGFKHEHFSVGYSYDLTVSKLGPGTAGSHEISFAYEFDNPKKRKKRGVPIPCPKF